MVNQIIYCKNVSVAIYIVMFVLAHLFSAYFSAIFVLLLQITSYKAY